MSDTIRQRWLDSTKSQELRDALNFRGVPATTGDALLASQQGTRGSPIVDASCVAGLELYKVSALQGTGRIDNNAFASSGDYLWASAGNLDLSLMMWNESRRGSAEAVNRSLSFGVLLRGDSSAAVRVEDVFGAVPAEMVLVSGTHAWRMRFRTSSSRGSSGASSRAAYLSNALAAGETTTAGGVSFNGWNTGELAYKGSQFAADTPLPFLVYCFTQEDRLTDNNIGGDILERLIAANYPTFRIYDFTLRTDTTEEGTELVAATMPPSMSGINTNAERLPDPDDSTALTGNPSFWYIGDAIVAPRSPRSVAVNDSWNGDRTFVVGRVFSIRNVLNEAFTVTPNTENVSIGISPNADQVNGATFTYDDNTSRFSFLASNTGVYRIIFTAVLRSEPGKRAQAVLTITVS